MSKPKTELMSDKEWADLLGRWSETRGPKWADAQIARILKRPAKERAALIAKIHKTASTPPVRPLGRRR